MPGAISKDHLVGSEVASDRPFLVHGTDVASKDTVHAPPLQADVVERITVWAWSIEGAADRLLTLLWGSGADAASALNVTVHPKVAPILVADGMPLVRGRGLYAYADVADKILLLVQVSRAL